jgi:hypothetical protein
MVPAASFFHPQFIDDALAAYARRPKARGWWVSEKARLYGLALEAFAPGDPDPRAMQEIHGTLRGYWQIFRNGEGWSAARIHRVLRSPACRACGRDVLDLPGLAAGHSVARVWPCLKAMSRVKKLPAGNVSAMAVSKFLHFFNPGLFPIYDRAVVRNKVFPRFREEIQGACDRWASVLEPIRSEPTFAMGLRDYVHYLVWAAETVRGVDVRASMATFGVAFREMLAQEKRDDAVPRGLDKYYAAAFEMAMVGALDVQTV